MTHSHDIQAVSTASATGAMALLAEMGAPPQVTWGAIALGLISLASLWVRGYWADSRARIRLEYSERDNAELRGRLSVYERPQAQSPERSCASNPIPITSS